MKYYFAPMEGINGYLYRQVHARIFPQMDKYFMPFLVPHEKKVFSNKELRELSPENNRNLTAIPQIMTNRPEDFVRTARKLMELGYQEVNLNLGCPSKTVVPKRRGAGFLGFPEELDRFLESIFDQLEMKISIKTRIGLESEEEFPILLKIYNRYPLEELIIHPRLQIDYYKNPIHLEVFRQGIEGSLSPVCYNGDLVVKEDFLRVAKEFPQEDRVMVGRGLLRNPGLIQEMTEGRSLDKIQLRRFHDEIYQAYRETLFGDRNILFRMKELWGFMAELFQDSKKYAKRIRKAQKLGEYEQAVDELFAQRELTGQREGERQ